MTGQLLDALTSADIEVDCFLSADLASIPEYLRDKPSLRLICRPSRWRYDRWYSRTDATKFATGLATRAVEQVALGRDVRRAHRGRRYDLVYQFSHPELSALRPSLRSLPPVVLHPEVHAEGELRWHRRERALALRSETPGHYAMAHAALAARSQLQRRDMRLAAGVIAPSRRFGDLVAADYGLRAERIHVVPNPIDLIRFRPSREPRVDGPVRLLFVSRLSVRKGVEMVVALSHRLADLAGRVSLEVIGSHALWSDYRGLLAGLHGPVATYRGAVSGSALPAVYRSADALVQPSHYEPFALTVGEALASGLPVVTSDEVGANEQVAGRCSERFPAGNLDAFEAAVRSLIVRLERGERDALRAEARAEATRLFGAQSVSAQLATALGVIAAISRPAGTT